MVKRPWKTVRPASIEIQIAVSKIYDQFVVSKLYDLWPRLWNEPFNSAFCISWQQNITPCWEFFLFLIAGSAWEPCKCWGIHSIHCNKESYAVPYSGVRPTPTRLVLWIWCNQLLWYVYSLMRLGKDAITSCTCLALGPICYYKNGCIPSTITAVFLQQKRLYSFNNNGCIPFCFVCTGTWN